MVELGLKPGSHARALALNHYAVNFPNCLSKHIAHTKHSFKSQSYLSAVSHVFPLMRVCGVVGINEGVVI